MKYLNFEKEHLYGAVATFNGDPFCVETEDEVEDVWSSAQNGIHLITDLDDYEVACYQLDLNPNGDLDIYETDDYMCKFCLL